MMASSKSDSFTAAPPNVAMPRSGEWLAQLGVQLLHRTQVCLESPMRAGPFMAVRNAASGFLFDKLVQVRAVAHGKAPAVF